MEPWGLHHHIGHSIYDPGHTTSDIRREAHAAAIRILEPEREGSEIGSAVRQSHRLTIEVDADDVITQLWWG